MTKISMNERTKTVMVKKNGGIISSEPPVHIILAIPNPMRMSTSELVFVNKHESHNNLLIGLTTHH